MLLRLLGDTALKERSLGLQVNLTNQIKTNAADDETVRRRNRRQRMMTRKRPRMMTTRRNMMIKEGKRKNTNIEILPVRMIMRVQKGTRKRRNSSKNRRKNSVDVMTVIQTAVTIAPQMIVAVVVVPVALLIVKKMNK